MGYHKIFHLRGINYKSKINPNYDRQYLITGIRKKDTFKLQEYTYKNKPALMVVNERTGLDIGVVPAEDVDKILPHINKPHTVVIKDRYYFEDNNSVGYKMQFQVIDQQKEAPSQAPPKQEGKPQYDFVTRLFYKLIGRDV